jgi:arabinose-5-phosphate isomerase
MSLESLRRVLIEEAEAVAAVAGRLDHSFVSAIDWIIACRGRVITCGLGKSGHIARKTNGTLASTGTPSLFLHAAEAMHGDLGMVTPDDVVLLYSYSGETRELLDVLPAIKAIGAATILMTGRLDSSGARMADLALDCSVEKEACPNNLAPTTSTTVMLALSDALAVAVMERRGFGPQDFARYHPAGSLGKRLTLRVRDVMRTGDDLALASPLVPLIEALGTITRSGAGAACVVDAEGHLVGFLSDGDVRRYILDRPDALQTPVGELATVKPTTIEPDMMAIDAFEAFQNLPKKIGEMPVVEAGRVVGLLVLKDLLRSGIV